MRDELRVDDVLTEHEIAMLTYATILGGGDEGVPEEDLGAVLTWAKQAQIDSAIVSEILFGRFLPRIVDGALEFRLATHAEREKFSTAAKLVLRKRAEMAAR